MLSIKKENYEHFYVIKFDNQNEGNNSLKYSCLSDPREKEIEICNNPLSKSNSCIKNFTRKKSLGPKNFTDYSNI